MKKLLSLFAAALFLSTLAFGQAIPIQVYSGSDMAGTCNYFPQSTPNPVSRYNTSTGNYFSCPNSSTPYAPVWTAFTPVSGNFVTSDGYGGLSATTVAATGTGSVVRSTSPILVTPALGTPSAINLNNATGSPLGAAVTQSIVIPLTLSQLQTLFSVGVQILPAPAATSLYVMGPCALNLTYGSAAFTGGGAVSIGYGATFASTTPSPLTHGTIAATVFTTFSASHAVVLIPASVAVTADTTMVGKPVFMSAATQDFAAGTGATGQVSCQYSIMTGVQ